MPLRAPMPYRADQDYLDNEESKDQTLNYDKVQANDNGSSTPPAPKPYTPPQPTNVQPTTDKAPTPLAQAPTFSQMQAAGEARPPMPTETIRPYADTTVLPPRNTELPPTAAPAPYETQVDKANRLQLENQAKLGDGATLADGLRVGTAGMLNGQKPDAQGRVSSGGGIEDRLLQMSPREQYETFGFTFSQNPQDWSAVGVADAQGVVRRADGTVAGMSTPGETVMEDKTTGRYLPLSKIKKQGWGATVNGAAPAPYKPTVAGSMAPPDEGDGPTGGGGGPVYVPPSFPPAAPPASPPPGATPPAAQPPATTPPGSTPPATSPPPGTEGVGPARPVGRPGQPGTETVENWTPSGTNTTNSQSSADILKMLMAGAMGKGNGSEVDAATRKALMEQFTNPSAYGLPQVKEAYDWLGGQIDDQYALKEKDLEEEMARRGLSAGSTIGAGRLADLNIGKRSAKESMAYDLAQNLAKDTGASRANAITQGGNYGQNASNSQLNWLKGLMGYGQQGFENDLATAEFNWKQDNAWQDFLMKLFGAGYGTAGG